jgi:hypothetical protein
MLGLGVRAEGGGEGVMDGYVVFAVLCFIFAAFLLGVGVGMAKTRREFNQRLTDMARKYHR